MPRKPAPWMVGLPPPKKYAIVYAIVPWRGDGLYTLDRAVRVYKTRGAAERYNVNDEGINVVREIDLEMNRETVLQLFLEAYQSDAPNISRRAGLKPKLTDLRLDVDHDTGEGYIANDQERFFLVVADPKYRLRFIQEL